jgi:hypothetical protein
MLVCNNVLIRRLKVDIVIVRNDIFKGRLKVDLVFDDGLKRRFFKVDIVMDASLQQPLKKTVRKCYFFLTTMFFKDNTFNGDIGIVVTF